MLNISKRSIPAVQLVISIAENGENPLPLSKVSGASLSYLEQLAAKLKKAGIIQAVRGPGGGYKLARATDQITLKEIINAVSGAYQPPTTKPEIAFDWLRVEAMHHAGIITIESILRDAR